MKKRIWVITAIIIGLVLFGVIGFKCFSARIVSEAAQLENIYIDVTQVADGIYEGHSELGPVVVDVRVIVENGNLTRVELIQHQNGLGLAAEKLAEDMVAKNTYDVDAVSGATVSSAVIINAVNDALQKGMQ